MQYRFIAAGHLLFGAIGFGVLAYLNTQNKPNLDNFATPSDPQQQSAASQHFPPRSSATTSSSSASTSSSSSDQASSSITGSSSSVPQPPVSKADIVAALDSEAKKSTGTYWFGVSPSSK